MTEQVPNTVDAKEKRFKFDKHFYILLVDTVCVLKAHIAKDGEI